LRMVPCGGRTDDPVPKFEIIGGTVSKSEPESAFEACVSECEAREAKIVKDEGWAYSNHASYQTCEQRCERYVKKKGRDRKPNRMPRSQR
jgi:hypothetical protein